MQILTGVEAVRAEREGPLRWQERVAQWFLRPGDQNEATLAELQKLAASAAGLASTAGVAERRTGHLFHDILGGRG